MINIEDVAPGDWIEGTYCGHRFAGEVWTTNNSYLYVGDTYIGGDYRAPEPVTLTSHTPKPKPLPTTTGSTVETRDEVVLMRTWGGLWCASHAVDTGDSFPLRWLFDDQVLALDLDRSLDHDRGAR